MHKFGRFFAAVLAVKVVEKGLRGRKEEHLRDYNARRANVAAAEKSMWEEELSLHAVNTTEAEDAVFRQRTVDWEFRNDQEGYANLMQALAFPFRVALQ